MASSLKRKWLGLIFISLAVSLIIVDSTIVNVAIPSIVDDLKASSTQVQWIQESYTLVFAAFLLVFGVLADRFGRRRLLLLGVSIFAIASILAALSQSGNLLIGSRILQGIGGAMVLPATLSIINATFRGKERAVAFAVWGSTIGGMSALGPLLGGWLTTAYSWRWAFGINVPLGIIIVVGTVIVVDESRDTASSRRIDGAGAFLTVLASVTLVFGLIEGRNYGWWLVHNSLTAGAWTWPLKLSPVPVAFAISVLSASLFILWGRARAHRGASTMLDFSLFSIPSFRNGNIAAMIVSLGEFGIILSLPIWLQNVLGFSALQTGLLLLPLAVGSFAASGFAGAFGNKVAAVTIVRVGIGLEIAGVAMLGFLISSTTPWTLLVPALFIYGIGVGLATAQLTGVVLKDVPQPKSGQASGTQSTARQIGSALGIAILGTVLFTTATVQLGNSLKEANVPAATREKIVTEVVESSGAAIRGLQNDPATQSSAEAARTAFSNGTKYSAFFAAGFLTLGLVATLSLNGDSSRTNPSRGVDSDDVRDTAHQS
ncbi:multidrug transporter [Arthrobacter alpinus]|uniref:Multidrug transporter n=1 Tax=Arthrobacter alpinus TaxID=656366 RepID=A0A0M4QMG3_9MICC|nr:MFS transporter [Arthrobacter alpinus]ALE92297.1 multidrug transporter [Arthrobacter alpinus]